MLDGAAALDAGARSLAGEVGGSARAPTLPNRRHHVLRHGAAACHPVSRGGRAGPR